MDAVSVWMPDDGNEEIMPTGKVKFFDEDKGFGFITSDEGGQVYVGQAALPASVTRLRPGTRVEFGLADGKRGPHALSVRVLDAPASVVKNTRRSAEDMAVVVEDLVKLLDGIGGGLRRGKYPEGSHATKVAAVLRRVADELDA